MKDAKSIGMFAAVALAIGMVGINFSDGTFALQNDMSSTYDEGASILGHLEIIHTDSEGNILSYQQTDNGIMNQGRDCVARALFGDHTAGGHDCTDTTPGTYTVIGLGNTTALQGGTITTGVDLPSEIADCGLARNTATSIVETQGAQTANADDSTAITTLSRTFTWDCTTNAVLSAGLFNSTTIANDSVFAMKDFPTAVNMALGDQLTVNWEITIDGSNAMS